MLRKEIQSIINKSRDWGWVLEPDAKKILFLRSIRTTRFAVAVNVKEAIMHARIIGYPVVAKVVSPDIIHKSDIKGVTVGIDSDPKVEQAFKRFSKLNGFAGMLVEETLKGVELIIGSKNDLQFGPMILLGIGGVGVEIYKDVSLRMAPLKTREADSMIDGLTARRLLTGYRGTEPINMAALKKTMINFSRLMIDLQDVAESVDLNPVMCSAKSCIVADARIMLKK